MVLGSAMAQNLNKTEAKAPAGIPSISRQWEKSTNGAALGYAGSGATVPGIKIANGQADRHRLERQNIRRSAQSPTSRNSRKGGGQRQQNSQHSIFGQPGPGEVEM